jgi:hypothetical protein
MATATSSNPLTRKAGPLPVWAWALLLIAAYFLYTRLRGNTAAAAPAANPVPLAPSTGATGDQSGGGSGIPQLPIPTSTTQLDPSGGSVPTTPATTPADAAAPVAAGAPPDAAYAVVLTPEQQYAALADPSVDPTLYGLTGPGGYLATHPFAGTLTASQALQLANASAPGSMLTSAPGPAASSPYMVTTPTSTPTVAPSYLTPDPSAGHAVLV